MTMNEICTGRTGTDLTHCWHDTGVMLCSYPPQIEQKCCFCGVIKIMRIAVTKQKGEHGIYVHNVEFSGECKRSLTDYAGT